MNVKKEDFYTMMLFVFSALLLAGMVFDIMQGIDVKHNSACVNDGCIKAPVTLNKEGIIREIKNEGVIEWSSP